MRSYTLCGTLFAVFAGSAVPGTFEIRDGDRIVFYGDSITAQRLYTTYVESYIATRFPDIDVSCFHSGWGGDRVTGGSGGTASVRLRRDVVAHAPTVVTVMLGMNDGRLQPFDDQFFTAYKNGYASLVQTLRNDLPGARLVLLKPSAYDDITRPGSFPDGYNSVLQQYGEYLAALGSSEGAGVVDLNRPVVSLLERAVEELPPATAQRLLPDRVHPSAAVHLVMAARIIAAWGGPGLVSEVAVDAQSGSVVLAENTSVDSLSVGPTVSWNQTDRSLPMPWNLRDTLTVFAIRAAALDSSLSAQPLSVRGLPQARYSLRIDKQAVGTFTSAELTAGINLTRFDTPMLRQALAVHDLTVKHNTVRDVRWRDIQMPYAEWGLQTLDAAIEALDNVQREFIGMRKALARPLTRRFELVPVP